jgi:GrpB-like predicted nucleotidyltransferase (UPF0157 family)
MSAPRPIIIIVDYDPRWPQMFREEKQRIEAAIGRWLAGVEHVGSTSVPGLAAKPIIDIMPALRSLEDTPHIIGPMRRLGYQYFPEYEDDLPERRYFRRPAGQEFRGGGTHHVHVVEATSGFWRRHIAFRDHLRAHPEAAAEYAALKRDLAARFGADREGYTEAKTDFIRGIETKALAEITEANVDPGIQTPTQGARP